MWKGTTKAKWEFPPKPSRMRLKTYRRLKQQYDELRGRWMAGVMGRFGIKAAINVARGPEPAPQPERLLPKEQQTRT